MAVSELGHAQRIEADYYRPQYLEVSARLEAVKSVPLTRHLGYLTDGTHVTPKYVPQGVPFLSSSDIDPFIVSPVIEKFISEAEHLRLRHCQPDSGDILMSKSGRIGSCAVVPASIKKGDWNIYEGIALLRVDGVEPHYVAAFLNSTYGHSQIRRELKGVAQPHLHLEDIRRLKLFVPHPDEMAAVSALVIGGMERAQQAHQLAQDAQVALETALGLDKLTFQKPVDYSARFSTVNWSSTFSAGRVDAQCFAPDALLYESWLQASTRCVSLWSLLKGTAKGRQQIESDVGVTDYCSIKHITGRELVGASKCCPQGDAPLAGVDDLLLAITGATIGKIGIVKRYERLAFSGDLLCLRVDESIDPHYLLLTLDHRIGQVQFNRWITGSTNGHLAPRDVARVLVPRLSREAESQLAELVRSSLAKRQESERLLNQAKTRVEQLIEAAVQP